MAKDTPIGWNTTCSYLPTSTLSLCAVARNSAEVVAKLVMDEASALTPASKVPSLHSVSINTFSNSSKTKYRTDIFP